MPQTPPNPPNPPQDKVVGVDRQLVERFLLLIRDNYPKADEAMFFMEERAGLTHTVALANLRDVLSHLSTMLQGDCDPKDWEAQLVSAEEHFRRAIQEPYAIALGTLREGYKPVYEGYTRILPHIRKAQKGGLFALAPTAKMIEEQLERISKLASEGRKGKRRNRTDGLWEEAVANYADAYDKLKALTNELSTYIHGYAASYESRVSIRWSVAGLVGTLGFGLLSLILILFPKFTASIQTILGVRP